MGKAASHVIPHPLDDAMAKKATDKAFESYAERFASYNPTANWTSDKRAEIGFSVKGVTLDGVIELRPKEIHLSLEVPFFARPFKKKALDVIEDQIKQWVAKAQNGELDD